MHIHSYWAGFIQTVGIVRAMAKNQLLCRRFDPPTEQILSTKYDLQVVVPGVAICVCDFSMFVKHLKKAELSYRVPHGNCLL